jgi:phage-related protein
MADFPWPSCTGSSEQHRPRVVVVRFGSGFEQRRPDGLNHQLRTWSRSISGIDPVVAEEIVTFLRARGGAESFTWMTDSGELVTVVCETWDSSPVRRDGVLRVNIAATFREVVA